MKKTFFLLMACLTFSTFLTSCLDDSENVMQGNNKFAIIKQTNGYTMASIAVDGFGFLLNSKDIEAYNAGDAMFINYKFGLNFIGETGIIRADIATPTSSADIFPVNSQIVPKIGIADTTITNNPNVIKSISTPIFSANNFYLDRWLFSYSADIVDGQRMNLEFTYDDTKQKDENGESLPSGSYIIDIRLNKTGTVNPGAATLTKEGKTVANFEQLRNKFQPTFGENDNQKTIILWFRYFKTVDGKQKLTYVKNAGAISYEKLQTGLN